MNESIHNHLWYFYLLYCFLFSPSKPEDPDDTIVALNVKNAHVSRGSNDLDSTSDLDRSSSQEDNQENIPPPHPAGICLRRAGYYIIPTLEELAEVTDESGECRVEDLTIGREGYGSVFFPGETDLTGMNLDEIGKTRYIKATENIAKS